MTVAAMRPQLSEEDIRRLIRGESPEERASVAHRLCRRIASDVLTDEERKHAKDIMAFLANDMAELVRRTLAVTLRNSPRLPRDLALKLAHDVESVAIPVLEGSPSFTDEDMIELALSVTVAKQAAIAARPRVPESVAEVLAEHGGVEAVRVLAKNKGAEWTDKAFADSLLRYGSDDDVQEGIVGRDHIPVHIAEKMVSLVSGHVFDMLVNKHELPAQVAIDIAAGARERATIDLVEQASRMQDLPRFAQQLNLNGRLTHSLIVRAICTGQLPFVEHALAELSGVPHKRVWLMIHDAGPLGLQAVFDRAGLPRKLLPAFKTAVATFHETELDGTQGDKERFKVKMIERVLTQFQAIAKDDLDYLLEKLDAYSDHGQSDEVVQLKADAS
ncbi:MAG: DUF2336 domain-containing protein [Hyphomonadaceae bacterium]